MRGIIENIKNKFICFNILFDYFFIKGNGYYAKTSLVSSVSELYYRLLKNSVIGKNKILSYKRILGILEPYNFLLRYKLGVSTYDEIRNYLARYTGNQEDAPLPNSQVVPEIISGVLSIAVIGVVHNSLNRINDFYQQLGVEKQTKFSLNTIFEEP